MSWNEELVKKFMEGEATPDELVRSGGGAYALIKQVFPEYFRGVTESIVEDTLMESNHTHDFQDKIRDTKRIKTTDGRLNGLTFGLRGRVQKVLEKHPSWRVKLDINFDNGRPAVLVYNTKGRFAKIIT